MSPENPSQSRGSALAYWQTAIAKKCPKGVLTMFEPVRKICAFQLWLQALAAHGPPGSQTLSCLCLRAFSP